MMVEGEERCLAKSGKAYVASVLQGFHCMMVEGEERCLAKSGKAYVASVLQGSHCMMIEGIEAVPGQECQSLCCFCVAGLELHDGVRGGAVPG